MRTQYCRRPELGASGFAGDDFVHGMQTAQTTPMHLSILTGFQLRLREALRWVSRPHHVRLLLQR